MVGDADMPLGRSVVAVLGTGTSNQVGAATGAMAFPVIGPGGVVAVRQVVAAVTLMAISRPQIRRLGWPQWWPVLALALIFSVMNLSLYTAIDRIGLGLAVTLEFLGPLGVALFASRGRSEWLIAVGAAVGVYVLILPDSSSDLPLFEAVVFPVAVNPETRLAAIARKRGWLVEHWSKAPGGPRPLLPIGPMMVERERRRSFL